MRSNWQLFQSAIDQQSCEAMIEKFKQIPPIDGTTFNGNPDHRKSVVRWVSGQWELQQILLRYVNIANATTFNIDAQQEMNEMQFGEYDASYGGKYDWHHDVDWENEKNYDRKLSIVVQLSNPDDYEGGNFEFSEVQSPHDLLWEKQGSILIFPSYLVHRVTPVTKGIRYSLVSWVRGPRWK